jgi:hypothetical protein
MAKTDSEMLGTFVHIVMGRGTSAYIVFRPGVSMGLTVFVIILSRVSCLVFRYDKVIDAPVVRYVQEYITCYVLLVRIIRTCMLS